MPDLDPAPDLDTIPIEALEGVPMCLLRSDDMWANSSHLINECQRKGFSPNTVCQCYDSPHGHAAGAGGLRHQLPAPSIVETHPSSTSTPSP